MTMSLTEKKAFVAARRMLVEKAIYTKAKRKTTVRAPPADAGLFGLPLDAVCMRDGVQTDHGLVPRIVVELRKRVEDSIETEGVYRQAGSKSRQAALKAELDKGNYAALETLPGNVHDYACLLKDFVRQCESGLLDTRYQEFEQIKQQCDEAERERYFLLVFHLLSPTTRALVKYVGRHLLAVSKRHTVNKMTTDNLAKIMAPNLTAHNSTPQELELMTSVARVVINSARHIGRHTGELTQWINAISDEEAPALYNALAQPRKRRKSSVVGLAVSTLAAARGAVSAMTPSSRAASYSLSGDAASSNDSSSSSSSNANGVGIGGLQTRSSIKRAASIRRSGRRSGAPKMHSSNQNRPNVKLLSATTKLSSPRRGGVNGSNDSNNGNSIGGNRRQQQRAAAMRNKMALRDPRAAARSRNTAMPASSALPTTATTRTAISITPLPSDVAAVAAAVTVQLKTKEVEYADPADVAAAMAKPVPSIPGGGAFKGRRSGRRRGSIKRAIQGGLRGSVKGVKRTMKRVGSSARLASGGGSTGGGHGGTINSAAGASTTEDRIDPWKALSQSSQTSSSGPEMEWDDMPGMGGAITVEDFLTGLTVPQVAAKVSQEQQQQQQQQQMQNKSAAAQRPMRPSRPAGPAPVPRPPANAMPCAVNSELRRKIRSRRQAPTLASSTAPKAPTRAAPVRPPRPVVVVTTTNEDAEQTQQVSTAKDTVPKPVPRRKRSKQSQPGVVVPQRETPKTAPSKSSPLKQMHSSVARGLRSPLKPMQMTA